MCTLCTMQYGKFMIIVIYSTWFDFQNECVLYCGFRLFKYESAANSVELISSSARLSWKVPQSGWKFQSFKQNAFSTAHTPFSSFGSPCKFSFWIHNEIRYADQNIQFSIELLKFNLYLQFIPSTLVRNDKTLLLIFINGYSWKIVILIENPLKNVIKNKIDQYLYPSNGFIRANDWFCDWKQQFMFKVLKWLRKIMNYSRCCKFIKLNIGLKHEWIEVSCTRVKKKVVLNCIFAGSAIHRYMT